MHFVFFFPAFVTVVCLVLAALGIFLMAYGDDQYIIDLIVVGALCLVCGVIVLILGMVAVCRPLYMERKLEEEIRNEERRNIMLNIGRGNVNQNC